MAGKVYVVTDLGPGDGGKGGVVQYLAKQLKAKAVIKEGGAQGSHGVMTATGEKFNFSQWGCGTLDGVPTFISERFVVSPIGLLQEAEALKHQQISDPFCLLTIDPKCIVATPYHQAWSQIDELRRRKDARGTIGTGVGKAYRQYAAEPDLAICAKDLVTNGKLWQMTALTAIREDIIDKLAEVSEAEVLPEDRELFNKNYELLFGCSQEVLEDIATKFCQVGKLIRLAELPDVLQAPGALIVEKSHGVLTDAKCGLKPHVSAIRTLPKFTQGMLRNAGFEGKIVNLAVHRAYEIRHGAGPMPSAEAELTRQLLPDSHKESNRFQGEVRVGPLDVVLMRYALEQARETPFDGLCLTWFDQIMQVGSWSFCTDYRKDGAVMTDYANLQREIFAVDGYERREVAVDAAAMRRDRKLLAEFCADTMREFIDLPVRMVSYGASELDKIIF